MTIVDGANVIDVQTFEQRWNVTVIIRRTCNWCERKTEGHNNLTNTAWRCNNCGGKFLVNG